MRVNFDEENIIIMGDGFRININSEDGLKLANDILNYYFEGEDDEID